MNKRVITGFWAFVLLFASGEIMGQNSINANVMNLNEGLIEVTEIHDGAPDTLISKLEFDIEVFIKKAGENRKGASRQKDPQGNHKANLDSLGGMGLDSSRLRPSNTTAVSLIFKIPSKRNNQGPPTLRGIQAKFDEHLAPTSTKVKILPGNSGIEIHYYFENGIPKLPDNHKHIKDEKGMLWHVLGHICDPTDPNC